MKRDAILQAFVDLLDNFKQEMLDAHDNNTTLEGKRAAYAAVGVKYSMGGDLSALAE